MKELENEEIRVVGLDVFVVKSRGGLPILQNPPSGMEQKLISNRGTKVWPGDKPDIDLANVYRCRFLLRDISQSLNSSKIFDLLSCLEGEGLEWVHLEKLLMIRGEKGFTVAQGE